MSNGRTLNIIAIIPARGGSKRVPRKNTLPIAGRPLVAHTIEHARRAATVSAVYVSTDDGEIAAIASELGAEVVHRPPELSNDSATSESALLHVLDTRGAQGLADPDLVVFLQCTSPVRRPHDIDKAVATLVESGADSLFSACENNRLIWGRRDDELFAINYDFRRRRREQDMAVQYRENGSIYVFKPAILRAESNRLGGKIVVYEMDYWSSFQIDTDEHAELAAWLMQRPQYAPEAAWPRQVALVVFDFDGVMTDNAVQVDQDGRESVRCLRSDGLGIDDLRRAGIPAMVLSTESNPVVRARCEKLRLPVEQAVSDKGAFLRQYLAGKAIDPAAVIYVGNDTNDLGCFEVVGFPIAVADAHPAVKAAARIVLASAGGQGAVREVCDRLIREAEGRR